MKSKLVEVELFEPKADHNNYKEVRVKGRYDEVAPAVTSAERLVEILNSRRPKGTKALTSSKIYLAALIKGMRLLEQEYDA